MVSDRIKEDSKKAIRDLKAKGVRTIAMLTGDSQEVAQKVGKELQIGEVYAQLLPHEKVAKLEMIEKNKGLKGKLVFVGDGINDAPVLARADIEYSHGALGSDAAIEAAV